VRVITGMDNTDHIKNYHLETTMTNFDKPRINVFSKDKNGGFI